jgi:hypothetical protein
MGHRCSREAHGVPTRPCAPRAACRTMPPRARRSLPAPSGSAGRRHKHRRRRNGPGFGPEAQWARGPHSETYVVTARIGRTTPSGGDHRMGGPGLRVRQMTDAHGRTCDDSYEDRKSELPRPTGMLEKPRQLQLVRSSFFYPRIIPAPSSEIFPPFSYLSRSSIPVRMPEPKALPVTVANVW